MNYMDFVAIRVTKISTVIAVTITGAWSRRALIYPLGGYATSIGCVYSSHRWSQKSHHTPIAFCSGLPVKRHINIKPW